MFKKNHRHLQIPLTSHVDDLPEKLRKRLENSWAGVFYRDFFCCINEAMFAGLYADFPSRPNMPINVLVGLEFLKAGNGWTDEELYDNFCYDIQVRYALGYRQLGEGDFDLRTLYYFRERLSCHMQERGVNLLDKAFEQVTDAQIAAYQVKTGKQRMDSFQVASNIRQMGRVQLLVEVLQRVHCMLNEADQQRYAEDFAPYLKGHAGHYVYRMKGEEVAPHLQSIGEFMQRLLVELQPGYGDEAAYQVLVRVFGEHFRFEQAKVTVKANQELSAASLQSPDDLEATYRQKRGQGYRGYAANVAETCDPHNELQLITKVQVEANTTDDSQFLAEALPDLKKRTGLETIYTDGGHGGPEADQVLAELQVEHIQTAIRGRTPDPDKLYLADFAIQFNEDGKPSKVTCPGEQTVPAFTSSQQKAFVAHFDADKCSACRLASQCPAQPGKRDPRRHLRFTQAEARAAERRRHSQEHRKESGNLRSAVEATVRCVKLPYPDAQVPVRGKFRVTCLMIGSSAVTNVQRIQRYLQAKIEGGKSAKDARNEQNSASETGSASFFGAARTLLQHFFHTWQAFRTLSGC
ncbi:MAG: transposase [Acidobacteriia bacterium]|nr:transposase [Terriglobia bacterium]